MSTPSDNSTHCEIFQGNTSAQRGESPAGAGQAALVSSPQASNAERTDVELLRCFQRGERDALGELYRRYERPLCEFLTRMVNDREAARDLVHEVFIRVTLHSKGFKGTSKVSTWLFAIAKNCSLSYLRHQKVVSRRIQREDADTFDGSWLERVASPLPSPEHRAVTSQEFGRVAKIIKQLNKDQQEVLVLREALEYAHGEIAEQLHCPENTVKTRTFRALGHVRKALGLEVGPRAAA